MLPETPRVETLETAWQRSERERQAERKERVEALTPQFTGCREAFITSYLKTAGIAPLELTADWDRIPEPIRKVFPIEWKSFGLVGGFGIGKTFALVAALRRLAAKRVDSRMGKLIQANEPYTIEQAITHGDLSMSPFPLWTNWPGDVARARGRLYENGAEVEGWILDLTNPERMLVLDDIGADRLAGNDWAGEVLARVIDDRLRNQGMTVWTSNLDVKEIMERYGPRTYSRLQALAPAIKIPKLPDLRLKGVL